MFTDIEILNTNNVDRSALVEIGIGNMLFEENITPI